MKKIYGNEKIKTKIGKELITGILKNHGVDILYPEDVEIVDRALNMAYRYGLLDGMNYVECLEQDLPLRDLVWGKTYGHSLTYPIVGKKKKKKRKIKKPRMRGTK